MKFIEKVRDSRSNEAVELELPTLAILGLVDRDDAATSEFLVSLKKSINVLPALALSLAIGVGLITFIEYQAGLWSRIADVGALTALAILALVMFAGLKSKIAFKMSPARRVNALFLLSIIVGGALGYCLASGLTSAERIPDGINAIILAIMLVSLVANGALPILQLGLLIGFSACFFLSGSLSASAAFGAFALSGLVPILVSRVMTDRAEIKRAAQERVESSKTSALITMFEESDRIWFWETDRNGRLTYASPKLLASFNKPKEQLLGTPLTDLIESGDDQQGASAKGDRTITFYLSNRLGFSDFPVRAAIAGSDQWWSMTGRPIIDSLGQFRGFRGNGSDFTEKRRSEAEINRLARSDSLTGLPNRSLMIQTLEQSLANAKVNPVSCALMLLDLDRFKIVNDTLGHPVGDGLLKLVAKRLEKVVGSAGRVGRLGGDEFTVVLPVAPAKTDIADIGAAIIHQLSQPYMVDGSNIVIGASIGIAIGPNDGDTADSIMRSADLALYVAKADGRGIQKFFDPSMRFEAEERRTIEADLRSALNKGDFSLVYQPVVCSTSERIVGCEALMRWMHPTRGPISPAVFIPIAEEVGLIQKIGDWALREACLEAAKWPAHVSIAVNVSPVQFSDPTFPSSVMNALAQSQLEPGRLELEITETVFLNEGEDTDAMLSNLKSIGVRLALDDFGTGYSALGYLRKAPFDKIKIDRSFVAGATVPGNRNAAIIKSVVSLAESLGMDTTAEGAETMDELELIRSLGCSHIQGYIFSKPLSAAEIEYELGGIDNIVQVNGFQHSRAARISMLRTANLKHGGYSVPVRIRNVSTTGVQIEISNPIPVGTSVSLDIGLRTELLCTAQWAAGGRMGLSFNGPIDVTLLTAQKPTRSEAA